MKYVAIEGIKGSGKSTLLADLGKQLTAQGIEFCLLSPTSHMPPWHPAELAYSALGLEKFDAITEWIYALRSNWHSARVSTRAPLIIGDRSVLTSYVTRWGRVRINGIADHLAKVNSLEHRIPKPDHVIYLDVDAAVAAERIQSRPARNYGKVDEGSGRLQDAINAYQYLMLNGKRHGLANIQWSVVNARRSYAEVFSDVLARLQTMIYEGRVVK